MISRVIVDTHGDIYIYVPDECIETLEGFGYDIFVFDGDNAEPYNASIHSDEEKFILVCNVREALKINETRYSSLESILSFFDRTGGSLPLGLAHMCKKNGWRREFLKGGSMRITDIKTGKRIYLIRSKPTDNDIKEQT